MKIVVLGISVYDRLKEAGHVQTILTRYGNSIKTRLGLHEISKENSSKSGLILIELWGDEHQQITLEQKLTAIPGVDVQKMEFKGLE